MQIIHERFCGGVEAQAGMGRKGILHRYDRVFQMFFEERHRGRGRRRLSQAKQFFMEK